MAVETENRGVKRSFSQIAQLIIWKCVAVSVSIVVGHKTLAGDISLKVASDH